MDLQGEKRRRTRECAPTRSPACNAHTYIYTYRHTYTQGSFEQLWRTICWSAERTELEFAAADDFSGFHATFSCENNSGIFNSMRRRSHDSSAVHVTRGIKFARLFGRVRRSAQYKRAEKSAVTFRVELTARSILCRAVKRHRPGVACAVA